MGSKGRHPASFSRSGSGDGGAESRARRPQRQSNVARQATCPHRRAAADGNWPKVVLVGVTRRRTHIAMSLSAWTSSTLMSSPAADRHCGVEFIALVQDMNACRPPETITHFALDNRSAHFLKEIVASLATRPEPLEHVRTSEHRCRLNPIKCAFSRRARALLRRIRVDSVPELKTRSLPKGIEEKNTTPVVFRWKTLDPAVA